MYIEMHINIPGPSTISALPSCYQKFLRFPRFFAPGYSFWRRTRIHRDPGSKIFFRRAKKVFNRLAEIRQNFKWSYLGFLLSYYLASPVLGSVLLVARALDYVSPRYALLGECLDR